MRRFETLVLCISASLCVGTPPAQAETARMLFHQALPDYPRQAATIVQVDIPRGGNAAPHGHGQASVFAYVLAGAVRSQLAGSAPKTYRAGEGWFEPPGSRHLLTENVSRKTPARLLVAFVATEGAPLKTLDEKGAEQAMPALLNSKPKAPSTSPAPQQMVDALYTAFGDHHSRAVHAKGVMAVGTFSPTRDAALLSKAAIFDHGVLPVVIRFSDFTGIPEIPDTVGDANPRGFAVKFRLPDGSSADVVSHSFNGFPTRTAAEFRELLLAIGASGAGAAKPTVLDAFLTTHLVAKTFLTTQKPAPESYTTLSYFGVNAFEFTNREGHREFVRYRFLPAQGEAFLSPEHVAAAGPNYLQAELRTRLAKTAMTFIWYAQLANPSDRIDDPSIAWPESRKLVRLGTITIEAIAPDEVSADKSTMFAPLNVPDGIAPADPMLGIRQGAYPLSFKHRQ